MPGMVAGVQRTRTIRILWCRSSTARLGNRANMVNRLFGGSMANRDAAEQMESKAAGGKEACIHVVGNLLRAGR